MRSPWQLITSFPSLVAAVMAACLLILSGPLAAITFAVVSVVALQTIAARAAVSPLPARVDDRSR